MTPGTNKREKFQGEFFGKEPDFRIPGVRKNSFDNTLRKLKKKGSQKLAGNTLIRERKRKERRRKKKEGGEEELRPPAKQKQGGVKSVYRTVFMKTKLQRIRPGVGKEELGIGQGVMKVGGKKKKNQEGAKDGVREGLLRGVAI